MSHKSASARHGAARAASSNQPWALGIWSSVSPHEQPNAGAGPPLPASLAAPNRDLAGPRVENLPG